MLDCTNWAANVADVAVASTVVAVSAVNNRPCVWIVCKWYVMQPQYPQKADG